MERMYQNKVLAVILPAYNEGTQIEHVVKSIPSYVDSIIVVDDCSTDDTVSVVQALHKSVPRLVLLKHKKNEGCGGALATGYKWARDNNMDIAVRMDADGQMDPQELQKLLDPVVTGKAQYAKGNRFFSGKAYEKIPKVRFFGNAALSLLTKIASGYWHVADSQSGYTALSRRVLCTLDWDKMYKRYGQPNNLLIMLNVNEFSVADVSIEPIYGVGEKSGIKIWKVIFTISFLLLKGFFWRLKEKYIIRDFHPLVFFYAMGIFSVGCAIVLFGRILFYVLGTGHIPPVNFLAALFSFSSGCQFLLFAMWFDMQNNKHLKS